VKQTYNKYMLRFYICIFLLAIISFAWSIIKASFIQWDVFKLNIINLNIYVGIIVGIYLIYFSAKEFLYYKKHGKLIHGYDERNAKVVSNAIRDAGLVVIIILLGMSYYYTLFYDFNKVLFSTTTIAYVLWAGVIVFFFSFWHYYKKKEL